MFLNYRVKNYLSQALLILGCLSIGVSKAMELPESHKREREKKEETILSAPKRLKASEYPEFEIEKKESSFEKLPRDIVGSIGTFLTSVLYPEQALFNFKSLSYVNKSIHSALTTPEATKLIIELVSQRFEADPLDIALLLRTQAALEWLKSYLKKNPQKMVKAKYKLGNAGEEGNLSLVNFLLNVGLEASDGYEVANIPFIKAALAGNGFVVDALLKRGFSNNLDKENGLLHEVIKMGYYTVVARLLKAGVDVNKADENGVTPLMVAVEVCSDYLVDLLLDNSAKIDKVNNEGDAAFDIAIERECSSIVDTLIKAGADINKENKRGIMPLSLAILYSSNITYKLIKAGADVNKANKDGKTPLMAAAYKKDKNLIDLLLKQGAKVDTVTNKGLTALLLALMPDDSSSVVVDTLIKAGADVNRESEQGDTPLIVAVAKRHCDVVARLIEAGAKVNAVNKLGDSALLQAAANGYLGIVAMLIKAGADINKGNNVGITPLGIAACLGYYDPVACLIKAGADFNKAEKINLWPPVYAAVYHNHKDIVELLLTVGADIYTKDNSGRTALDIAREKGYQEIVELLQKASTIKST
jgi:uncharacterized protein